MSEQQAAPELPSTETVTEHYSEAAGQEGVTETVSAPNDEALEAPEGAAQPAPAGEPTAFYDATKVPDALKPTFLEMQRAVTQKFQEIAPFRKLMEDFGGVDATRDFLEQFQTPDGVVAWWLDVAERMGLTRSELEALFRGEQIQPQNQLEQPQEPNLGDPNAQQFDPHDPNRPLTLGEWQAHLAQQQRTQQEQAEDAELISSLREFEVPDTARRFVLGEAARHPKHLGTRERIRRAKAAFDAIIEERRAEAVATANQQRETAPAPLNGGVPAPSSKPATDLDQARERAEKRPLFTRD